MGKEVVRKDPEDIARRRKRGIRIKLKDRVLETSYLKALLVRHTHAQFSLAPWPSGLAAMGPGIITGHFSRFHFLFLMLKAQ